MLNVFICEDNDKQRLVFENYINDIIIMHDLDMEVKLSTNNPNEVLKSMKELKESGIYFLDIDLKSDCNGLTLAEQIRKYDTRGFIVFLTSHSEMSYLTFLYRLEVLDFIIKSNLKEIKDRIAKCLLSAIERYSQRSEKHKMFTIQIGDKVISFQYQNILFFETVSSTHRLIVHEDNRQVEFFGRLKDLQNNLDSRFVRVHKSFLVNKERIKEIDKVNKIIYMDNGQECLASVRLIKNIL